MVGIDLVWLVRLLVTDSAVLAELLRIIFHNSKKILAASVTCTNSNPDLQERKYI